MELWGKVPSEVSRFSTTVTYDRAGNGMSDAPTTVRDAQHIATELHIAPLNANVPS